jgi:hypothetical protein
MVSEDFQRITRCYIPEHRTIHNHCCENLKSYINWSGSKQNPVAEFCDHDDAASSYINSREFLYLLPRSQGRLWSRVLNCAGVRAGAKVQATEVPVRPREGAPRQSHPPHAYTGKAPNTSQHALHQLPIVDMQSVRQESIFFFTHCTLWPAPIRKSFWNNVAFTHCVGQRFPDWWVASRLVVGREKFLKCDFF